MDATGEQSPPHRGLESQLPARELHRTVSGNDDVRRAFRHPAAGSARGAHQRCELGHCRNVQFDGRPLRGDLSLDQRGLGGPEVVDPREPPARGAGGRLRRERRADRQIRIRGIDGVEFPELAGELDEVAVGITHVHRLDHLVRDLDGHVQAVLFEPFLPAAQLLDGLRPATPCGLHRRRGPPAPARGLRGSPCRRVHPRRGSRRRRSCCRCRCRRRSAGNRGGSPGPTLARKSRGPEAGRACPGRTRSSRAASRSGGRYGPRRGGRAGRHGDRVAGFMDGGSCLELKGQVGNVCLQPLGELAAGAGTARLLVRRQGRGHGGRRACACGACRSTGIDSTMRCTSPGKHAWSPVYSTISVGCTRAAAVFSSVAFDEMPDHVDSQLSGVHWRAKPTAP